MWAKFIALFLWIPVRCTGNHFIAQVVRDSEISLLAIRTDHCPHQWLQKLLKEPAVPVVLQSMTNTSVVQPFSNQLQVICMPAVESASKEQETTLFQSIGMKRTIFLVDGTGEHIEQRIYSILEQCYKLKVLNVIVVLLSQGEETDFYYGYSPYPWFMLKKRPKDKRPFFMHYKQFPNMHKQPLTILPEQKHPRTIIYQDRRTGSHVLAGSIGHFVHTLAWKLNATMEYPLGLRPGPSLHPRKMLELAERHQIDILAGVMILEQPQQLAHMSYPVELSHICLMIPLAQPVPIKDIFLTLFSVQHILIALAVVYGIGWILSLQRRLTGSPTYLTDYLLDEDALRGLLGQSFRQQLQNQTVGSRWIYLLLAFLGLNLSSIHEAALGTLLTHPPKYFQPRTFEDLRRFKIPLVVDSAGFNTTNRNTSRMLSNLISPVNVRELDRLRDNMNQSNAYLTSRLKWTLLKQQQKYFPQEVFIYSMDACVSPLTLMGFQLPANSWFEQPINRLILDARASGLFQHWFEMHFYEMVAAGLISFSDPIQRQLPRVGGSLRLEDLQWISFAYAFLLTIAVVVFALEGIIHKISR